MTPQKQYMIHEFAKLSGVKSSTLRYYDSIGIFSPVGRNPDNNYRFYSLEQLPTLNFVSTLSNLGIPLKTILEFQENRDARTLVSLLEKRERELDQELRALRITSSVIHARAGLIRSGLVVDDAEIAVVLLESQSMALWPRNEYKQGDTFLNPLADIISEASLHHINLRFPIGGYWGSIEQFSKEPAHPEHFFSLDPTGIHVQPAGDYLIGYARGYYGEMGDLPGRIAAYASKERITLFGPVYITYLLDEYSEKDSERYLAQAYVAILSKP